MLLILLCLLTVASASDETSEISFEKHFEVFSRIRHPLYEGGETWIGARAYIKEQLHHYGISDIQGQKFNTSIGPSLREGSRQIQGINIIAVREGTNKSGPVVVVGADYDSTLRGDPLRNNGGGVACMLETARLVENHLQKADYRLNFTIVYVAFDLNTREYSPPTGRGRPGSFFFVREWLNNFLEMNRVPFRGAIILDSVTTYNHKNGSQLKTLLREGFEDSFPGAFRDIRREGNRGDFLGMLYPSKYKDNPIKTTYEKNFNKERMDNGNFRLQEMELYFDGETIVGDVLSLFNHQAQYHFWSITENSKDHAAFLLFDTDDDRLVPVGEEPCGPSSCDPQQFLTDEKNEIMTTTTKALVATLLDLQATKLEDETTTPKPSIAGKVETSAFFLAFCLLFQRLSFR